MRLGQFVAPKITAGPRTVAPPAPTRGTRLTERVPPANERWWDRALCKGQGGAGSVWWEPWKHPARVVEAAVALCQRCPVKQQCAAEDLGHCIQGGVAHTSAIRSIGPRPKKQRICRWCASMFEGVTREYCTDACLRSARRDRERKAAAANNRIRV